MNKDNNCLVTTEKVGEVRTKYTYKGTIKDILQNKELKEKAKLYSQRDKSILMVNVKFDDTLYSIEQALFELILYPEKNIIIEVLQKNKTWYEQPDLKFPFSIYHTRNRMDHIGSVGVAKTIKSIINVDSSNTLNTLITQLPDIDEYKII